MAAASGGKPPTLSSSSPSSSSSHKPFEFSSDPPPRLSLSPEQLQYCSEAITRLKEKLRVPELLKQEFDRLQKHFRPLRPGIQHTSDFCSSHKGVSFNVCFSVGMDHGDQLLLQQRSALHDNWLNLPRGWLSPISNKIFYQHHRIFLD